MQVGAQKATQSRSNSEGTKPMKNAMNIQGTGNTIVQLTPGRDLALPGKAMTFFASPVQTGLSAALGALRAGYVLVGNVRATDGTAATIGPGSLQVIDCKSHSLADRSRLRWAKRQAVCRLERGSLVFSDSHLHGPLGLKFAPNGHLPAANGDATSKADPEHPSESIEFTVGG